jgi:hypothetical protein
LCWQDCKILREVTAKCVGNRRGINHLHFSLLKADQGAAMVGDEVPNHLPHGRIIETADIPIQQDTGLVTKHWN